MDNSNLIGSSHERSQTYGVPISRKYPENRLSENDFEVRLKENDELLSHASYIILQLYKTVAGSGFFINVTDAQGCILTIKGDEEVMRGAEKLQMVEGAYMNEASIGTNSMGLAIHERKPVQVTAQEHFISAYHNWTCSAAPIMLDDQVIGCINMTGHADLVHSHTLGMVISAAHAIENRISQQKVLQKLETSNQFAFAMMNNLAFGVMAINISDEVEWVNDTACRLINIRRTDLLSKDVNSLMTDWRRIKRIILNELKFIDEHTSFNIPEINEQFLFNAYVIRGENSAMHGYLLTFRPFSRIVDLIRKYQNHHTRFSFDNIVAESPSMRQLVENAQQVATKPSTILLSGESGTGKEVLAQSIHNASLRKDGPFIALNCGAIASTLIESELFGYEEGAFTGAKKGGAPGKFELANHGTLFLDEVGDMPLDMQVKLLRCIQEGYVTRVGGKKDMRVDVRIIAASNKNLQLEIEKENFRLDLYYRLNVINLHVPALRDRKADIMHMARFFAAQKAEKMGKPMPFIDSRVSLFLENYSWPGNVRELENMMERFVVLDGNMDSLLNQNNTASEQMPIAAVQNTNQSFTPQTLAEIEKNAIISCLKTYDFNISKAAKVLNISRNTLYLKIKKYNISLG
ncbi:Acetoin dehydrogenase operon transcriptional activator AcoR [Salinivirga cyanobacteriivorans]|uniref:Acetoin dehydrogenase operon transcriptional activator AcoR n=1 Tax=Salinivirga cyanobacteriivorans TaxID=1307839 RepID=A0A0S2I1W0_9BACT|nr:sigma 54-interacting transcriptional regulator [Salinivirga cyanobacteriivorans]ALO16181.1 Acetoin dehydrogenase operon transcriptional activator AcoR [Salinivirga cyanobacteriivorans]